MNVAVFDGYVKGEPRLNMRDGQTTLVTFTVANRRYVGKSSSGENEHDTGFFLVKAFGFNVRRAQQVHDGDKVVVRGELAQDRWVDKDGQTKSMICVHMQDLEFEIPAQTQR